MNRLRGLIVLLVAGCAASGAPPGDDPAPAGGVGEVQSGREGIGLVPPGHGTLRQDEFTISLRSGALLVKVTPLAEAVIRLAAPDTYNRLHALAESRRAEAASAAMADGPELYLVSFFSYEPDVVFQPEDLQLVQQGRLFRARAVLPVTPGWGKQRLQQQETQSALYVFEPGIDYALPLVVRYGVAESDDWSRIIPVLEEEHAKVRARAATG
ncbi:MAG TPA: hypothetical protein VIL18_09290 [Longimicrobiales bacterium]